MVLHSAVKSFTEYGSIRHKCFTNDLWHNIESVLAVITTVFCYAKCSHRLWLHVVILFLNWFASNMNFSISLVSQLSLIQFISIIWLHALCSSKAIHRHEHSRPIFNSSCRAVLHRIFLNDAKYIIDCCVCVQYVLVKFLEPRKPTAERLGIGSIRFFGFTQKFHFSEDSVVQVLFSNR
jgi:hypothetical protein